MEGETVVLIIFIIITVAGVFLCWDSIKTIPWRIHYSLMGIFGNECPRCHRRYLGPTSQPEKERK